MVKAMFQEGLVAVADEAGARVQRRRQQKFTRERWPQWKDSMPLEQFGFIYSGSILEKASL